MILDPLTIHDSFILLRNKKMEMQEMQLIAIKCIEINYCKMCVCMYVFLEAAYMQSNN